MDQEFTIEPLKLIQDQDGYGIAQLNKQNTWEVIANFKYPLDAVKYFAEYMMALNQQITFEQQLNNDGIIDD
jgi:hypothetical protein